MTLERPNIDALSIINRMKEVLGKETDTELAKILDVSNKTISSWKNRNSVPMEIVVSVAFASNKSAEYLISGKEIKYSIEELNSQIKSMDCDIMQIIGETILKEILSEFDEEGLEFMEDTEIQRRGRIIGSKIALDYAHLHNERKLLVEEGGLPIEKFMEFQRRSNEINLDAIELRKRLKEEK